MKSKPSVALQAAEAIGAMVKQGTRSTGKRLGKPLKGKKQPNNVSKRAEQAARPTQTKPTKPEPKKPEPKKTNPPKPPRPPRPPKDKETKPKNSYFKQKFDTPPVDLSFDKDPGYTVKDKRSR